MFHKRPLPVRIEWLCMLALLAMVRLAAAQSPGHEIRVVIWPHDDAQRAWIEALRLPIEKRVGDSIVVGGIDENILEGLKVEGITFRVVEASPVVQMRHGPLDVRGRPLLASDFPSESAVIPFVVAFDDPLDDAAVAQVEGAGARIVGSLPPSALLVRGNVLAAASLSAVAGVAGVAPLLPEHRVGPNVHFAPGPQVVDVGGFAGDARDALDATVAPFGRVIERFLLGARPVLRLEIDGADVLAIASLPDVEWIEGRAQGSVYNEKMRVLMQTERTFSGANPDFYNPVYGIGVYGASELIAVTDEGMLWPVLHDVLAQQLPLPKVAAYYVPNNSTATLGDWTGHGTGVACTAAGDSIGPVSGQYGWPNDRDGLAIRSRLIIQDIVNGAAVFLPPPDPIADCLLRAFNEGARVHNNSWGHGPTPTTPHDGFYSMRSYALDEFLKLPAYRESVQVFADGDFGAPWTGTPFYQSYSLSEESHAKNVISVGGCRNGILHREMYTYSSRGPTMDCTGGCATPGRVKPDIVAPGSQVWTADSGGPSTYIEQFGTSFSAPAVAGAAALIRDYFEQNIYPVVPSDPPLGGEPSSALIKAMLVNSTVFLTDQSAYLGNVPLGYPPNAWPNFDQGYGRPALDTVLEPAGYRKLKVYEDANTRVGQGQLWTKTITFKEKWGVGCNTLRVSVAWTDKPMTMSAGKALVHDLDLEVVYGGVTYLGNYLHTGGTPDRLNNVEDIFVPLGAVPINTLHTVVVRVLGTSVTPLARQPFAVVATYGPCFDNTPCPTGGGCYMGPGDIVPGMNPPSGSGPACEGQHYVTDECVDCGEDPSLDCNPPPAYQPADPGPIGGHG